jgi:amidophosphoribosyltransferase
MSRKRGVHTVDILPLELENIAGQKVSDKCGVVALLEDSGVEYRLIQSLRILQHRGQESAGICIYNGKNLKVYKGMGLVREVFSQIKIDQTGDRGIGHIRYSTAGSSVIDNAQPIFSRVGKYEIAMGHNGEIVNAEEIRNELESKGYSFNTTSDTEVILRLLAINLARGEDIIDAMKLTFSKIRGAYSLVIMINERVFGVRDPNAIRPLAIGKTKKGFGIASENVVFEQLGGKIIRDFYPGEIIELTENGYKSYRFGNESPAHCMFEYVYFARPDSTIDGRNVFEVRKKIGEILARECPADADIVIPVPDSGRSHALGYSIGSGIPFVEGLIKNRYVDRTFIMPTQNKREDELDIKLNPIKEVVQDKRVVLVDDSIVRGNTMRKIVKLLRDAGAKEVHVRVGSPPIKYPCYLGIDMKTKEQFVAKEGKSLDELAKEFGANSVAYVSIDGLVEAIGFEKNNLCLGCLIGKYPIPITNLNANNFT